MDQHGDRMRYSIVVPAYNEAAYLPTSIASLQQQDFAGPYEIIVVDNNSTDDTAVVARGYDVRVVSESQQGVCAARQRGAEAAAGEILVSVDADTSYPPHWLRTIDERFTAEPESIAVAGPCRYENPSWWAKLFPMLLFGLVAQVFAVTGFVGYVSATNIAVRRSAFPGYNTRLTQGGDELDLLRRLRRGGKVEWDRRNIVTTSARRMQRGLLYNLVVSGFVYYFLGYWLNRIFAHRPIGMAPAFRQGLKISHQRLHLPRRRWGRIVLTATVLALGVTSLSLVRYVGPEAVASLNEFWNSP
jgi:glycosyltransferase involved in cell wall biosynthesis